MRVCWARRSPALPEIYMEAMRNATKITGMFLFTFCLAFCSLSDVMLSSFGFISSRHKFLPKPAHPFNHKNLALTVNFP